MAGKEATVYILDLGKSMGEKRYGRDQTDLDWAMEYVWDKITTTVSRRSFGDLVRRLLECFWVLMMRYSLDSRKRYVRWTHANARLGRDRQEKRADERHWLSHG
jgi:hypothetical protein